MEKQDKTKIALAIDLAIRYGHIDGDHHKMWVIDQIVRILAGKRYAKIIRESCDGEDGKNTWEWDTGIAPQEPPMNEIDKIKDLVSWYFDTPATDKRDIDRFQLMQWLLDLVNYVEAFEFCMNSDETFESTIEGRDRVQAARRKLGLEP
jgi:hypothetical protein